MRAFPIAAAALIALSVPSAALAQDADIVADDNGEAALSQLSETLADPVFQDQMSAVAGVLVTSMLDLEIGPMMAAVDQATGGAVSERGRDIDPDARVRDLAPDADDIPDQVAEKLPQAMSAMAVMSDGMADMLPALKAMAERMRGAFEEAQAER